MAYLIIERGQDAGKTIPLQKMAVIGGIRENVDRRATILLPDTKISRFHATLFLRGQEWYLRDEQSRNGTLINGEVLEAGGEARLCPGDLIRVGMHLISFRDEREKVELEKRLPDIEILQVLETSMLSDTYRAQQKSLDRIVVLRVLPPRALLDKPDVYRQFQEEARHLAKLDHPSIVRLLGFGGGRVPHLLLEHVQGERLSKRLLREERLPTPTAIELLRNTAKALRFAHRQQVLHRAITLRNIILLKDGRVKLIDFGLASVGASSGDAAVQAPLEYVPPELLEAGSGQESVTPHTEASDIYMLGVVFYAMVTGRMPFLAKSPEGLLQKIRNEAPPPVAAWLPEAPAGLDAFIGRLLEKNPLKRIASADELLRELQEFSDLHLLEQRDEGTFHSMLKNSPTLFWKLFPAGAALILAILWWGHKLLHG